MDNYVNYKLLITLIMGVDNVSKNYYISMKQANDKFLITPWDMDLSYGNNWDTNSFTLYANPPLEAASLLIALELYILT